MRPRLRLAALHAEGDAGYLNGVLSFRQTVTVRQFVLGAGSRGKEQCGCGKKYMDGMSFLHIGLSFICFKLRAAAACEGGRRTIVPMGSSGLTLAPGQRCGGLKIYIYSFIHQGPLDNLTGYFHLIVVDGDVVVVLLAALELAVLNG